MLLPYQSQHQMMAKATNGSPPLHYFMNDLLSSYGRLPVAHDNARLSSEVSLGSSCSTFGAESPCLQRPNRLPNRWGNSSPATVLQTEGVTPKSPDGRKKVRKPSPPPPPPQDFSPCRWQCLSPGGRDSLHSPMLPSRKKAVKYEPSSIKRMALPTNLGDLPY